MKLNFGSKSQTLAFAVVVGVLGVAAASLNVATGALSLYFKKEPVEMAKPLVLLPETVGPWVQVSKDQPLPPDIEEALGTKLYIFRDYVDSRIVPRDDIELMKKADRPQQMQMMARLRAQRPTAIMNMAVTYYTGMVDTVAHIPDRCYIADGYQPSEYEQPTWSLNRSDGKPKDLQVRFINFVDQTGARQSIDRSVTYLFHVNGKYECDPVAVRLSLQDLMAKYAYYSKVELMMLMSDRNEVARVKTDFLSFALPELEKCWPDWEKVNKGDKELAGEPAKTQAQ